jgi:hypothetical protein
MKQDTLLKFHHIIGIENNFWLDRNTAFSFHLSSHSPPFMTMWHKIPISFHMKELAKGRKIDRINGGACQNIWRKACSSSITIQLVNKRINVSQLLRSKVRDVVGICLCRDMSTGLSVRTYRSRPEQTRSDLQTGQKLLLTAVKTFQLGAVFFPTWRVFDWTLPQ